MRRASSRVAALRSVVAAGRVCGSNAQRPSLNVSVTTGRRQPVLQQRRSVHTSSTSLSDTLSVHKDTPDNTENTPFDFAPENLPKVDKILAKYPPHYARSAIMPLLDLAQAQCGGWLPVAAMNKVAKVCDVPPMDVYEVASFYTMYNRTKVGKYFVQVCTTTPCMVCGSAAVVDACKQNLGVELGGSTDDGLFTLIEVECLGACVNAPMLMVNDVYYEDLTAESTHALLDALRAGKTVPAGPQGDGHRRNCEPAHGLTTLTDESSFKPGHGIRDDL